MLYSRYSNPMDLVSRYIKRGRFGKFVHEFLESEFKRKKDKANEDKDWKLWLAYIHSYSGETFGTWKQKIDGSNESNGGDFNLDNNGIQSIINNLFPEDGGETN